jgi:hypothetical protein
MPWDSTFFLIIFLPCYLILEKLLPKSGPVFKWHVNFPSDCKCSKVLHVGPLVSKSRNNPLSNWQHIVSVSHQCVLFTNKRPKGRRSADRNMSIENGSIYEWHEREGDWLLPKNLESAGNYCKEFVDRLWKWLLSLIQPKILLILEIGHHSDCPVEIMPLPNVQIAAKFLPHRK